MVCAVEGAGKALRECEEMMLSCKEATRLMTETLDRPLSLRERMALRLHTLICGGCRCARQQFVTLRAMSRTWIPGRD